MKQRYKKTLSTANKSLIILLNLDSFLELISHVICSTILNMPITNIQ